MLTLAESRVFVDSLLAVVHEWSVFMRKFREEVMNVCSHAHACYHGVIYILVGLVSTTSLADALIEVEDELI